MEKKLSGFDAFMIVICGIMFADTIASNSSAGVPALTWWLILGVLYMIPSGLIIGELSGYLPGDGGIYVWISEGLGPKWGAMASWLFFVCGLFIPVSSFTMCADILTSLFFPSASFIVKVVIALVLVWVLAAVSTLPMADSQWLTNSAGIIKVALFVLCGVAGIAYLVSGHAPANQINASTLAPTLDESIEFLPIIVYCCTGMELASASAEHMSNPAKMLPRVVAGCATLAVALNIFADWGMLNIVKVGDIDLDLSLLNVFAKGFGLPVLYYVVGALFLYSVFVQGMTGLVGNNRGTCEGAQSGDLPAFLGRERNGQPIGAILTTAIASSVLLLLYALTASSASELFLSLLNCGVIGSLLPYVFMIVAYQRMKKTPKMRAYEGFKCPGGVALSWVVQVIQCFTLLLMLYVPGVGLSSSFTTNFWGAVGMIGTGLVAIWWAGRSKRSEKATEGA